MAENFVDDFKLSLICKKVYFLSHLISFYTQNVEIKHEKGYFLFKKLKTVLNRIRKHALFGRKFLTFAHVPRLEKLYLCPDLVENHLFKLFGISVFGMTKTNSIPIFCTSLSGFEWDSHKEEKWAEEELTQGFREEVS